MSPILLVSGVSRPVRSRANARLRLLIPEYLLSYCGPTFQFLQNMLRDEGGV